MLARSRQLAASFFTQLAGGDSDVNGRTLSPFPTEAGQSHNRTKLGRRRVLETRLSARFSLVTKIRQEAIHVAARGWKKVIESRNTLSAVHSPSIGIWPPACMRIWAVV